MADGGAAGPFVGPRAFGREEAPLFFGREGETQELLSFVVAHRVTLLYAPSGTGKTSLLNAGLLPLIEDAFEVLPPARLRAALDADAWAHGNAYVLALLCSWDATAGPDASVTAWLSARPHVRDAYGLDRPRLMVLDQFEEIFAAPQRGPERSAFLQQLAEALAADPLLRVVIGLREDRLADFDAIEVAFGEDGVRARLRLAPLTVEAALAAVLGPPDAIGRPLARAVAEAIVEDLRRIGIASGEEVLGDSVEPFQLQLVCQDVWSRITAGDLEAVGAVSGSGALLRFYEAAVSEAARKAAIPDGLVRRWLEEALITPLGTRASVLRERGTTGGMSNVAVDVLEERRVLRAESRLRASWYELTHDRLIETVRRGNRLAEDAVRRELPSEPVDPGAEEPGGQEDGELGFALCLSGGGHRAALFQTGVLWRLNELGVLRKLDRISAVSGASLAAAVLGRNWSDLVFGADGVAANVERALVVPVRAIAASTLDGPTILKALALPGRSAAELLAGRLRAVLGDATLQDLPDRPRVVIVSTSLQSGATWRFSKPYMGDHRAGVVARPDLDLATAVAASSALPPVSAMVLRFQPGQLDPHDTVTADPSVPERAYLADGMLSDPLALETAWKRYRTVLISDATGALRRVGTPEGWLAQWQRVVGLALTQNRTLRKRQAVSAYMTGQRQGAYWAIASSLDSYGLADALPCPHPATLALASIPARYAAVDDRTQERLINWGYAVCDAAMRRHVVPDATVAKRFPYPDAGVG